MEILLLIVIIIWCRSSIGKTNSRVKILENDIFKLKTQLELGKFNSSPPPSPAIYNTIIPAPEVPEKARDEIPEEPVTVEEKVEEKPAAGPAPIPQPAYVREEIKIPAYISNAETPYKSEFSSEPLIPEWVMGYLSGGKLFVTLGLGILFIGIAMLFKYTAQFMTFPIELRFVSVAAGAIGLMLFGHKQIGSRRDYGLYLFGGGLGILFMTVFTAFKFYALISPGLTFVLLGVIGLATFYFAILYDTMPLAVLAVTGGFLAPILTSTGNGSHIGLFSYYLLLNLIIFAIAWKKSWRVLNSIGFAFTFIIGLSWGGKYYVPEFYESVQAFLIIYFLLYVGIGVLFASRSKPDITLPIDAASVFGVPLIGFSLQLALTKYFPNGHTISCLAFGAFYLVACAVLRRSERDGWKLLSEIFAWLSALFFTLAVPFAFDAGTTAPLWSMEGVALLWMMSRSRQPLYGYAGILLVTLSNIFLFKILDTQGLGAPFANGFFLSAIILAISHFLAAHFLNPNRSILIDTEVVASIFSIVGMAWWFWVVGAEIQKVVTDKNMLVAWLVFYAVSCLASMLVYKRFAVALFDKPVTLLLPAVIGFSAINILGTGSGYHPLMGYGYIAYAASFAVHYLWLWENRDREFKWHQVMGYITLVVLAGFELGYYTHMLGHDEIYKEAGWLLAALSGIMLLVLPEKYRKWPFTSLSGKYQQDISAPLILWSALLCFHSFMSIPDGRYIPVFNLIDAVEILTVMSLAMFWIRSNINAESKRFLIIIVCALAFLLINCMVLRFMSSLMLPYLSHTMFDSVTVQTTLTILWTLTAMATMLISSQKGYRDAWFAGAALLGIVVLKLFMIDLDGVGTISRIVSFMGVGLLTISLGYFSPVPAKKLVSD